MKTNKLPQSVWNDEQAAGSQSQQVNQLNTNYQARDKTQQTGHASNDESYGSEDSHHLAEHTYLKDSHEPKNGYDLKDTNAAHNSLDNSFMKTEESAMDIENVSINETSMSSGYKKATPATDISPTTTYHSDELVQQTPDYTEKNDIEKNHLASPSTPPGAGIPERVFMNGLVKHTAIALAIIVPLAAFSAYAAPLPMAAISTTDKATNNATPATLAIESPPIVHKSISTPTTVGSVDFK